MSELNLIQEAQSLAVQNLLSRRVLQIGSVDRNTADRFRVQVEVSDGNRLEQDYYFVNGTEEESVKVAKAKATMEFLAKPNVPAASVEVNVGASAEADAQPPVVDKKADAAAKKKEAAAKKKAAAAAKKAAAKITKYDRSKKPHRTRLGEVLTTNVPDWQGTEESMSLARGLSEKLNGSDFLDADGEVVPSFVDAVKAGMVEPDDGL